MNLKNLFKVSSALSCVLAASLANAQTVEYKGSGTANWSDVVSGTGLQSGNNFSVTNNSENSPLTLQNITDFSLGDFSVFADNLTTNTTITLFGISTGQTLSAKNITISNRSTFYGGSIIASGNLLINTTNDNGKLVSSLGQNNSGNLEKLKVGGNLTSSYASVLYGYEGVMIAVWSNARSTEAFNAAYWNDADIDIGGKLEVAGAAKIYTSLQKTNTYTTNVYAKIGALVASTSHAQLQIMANSTSAKQNGVLNLMITGKGSDYTDNTATFTSLNRSGTIGEIALFMNSSDGKLIQKFTGTNSFGAGITMTSGTLLLNFKDGVTTSHGNLNMQGGTFGSSNSAGGTFYLSALNYKDGTVALTLASASDFDNLSLSDTIKFDAEAASSAKVAFDFGSSLAWLIDSAENEGKGVKVVSWANQSSISDETGFKANNYTDGEGKVFVADFTSAADGLYVKYVAVPEPATVAAIFGALALALAAYRRRK